jgi:pyruvate dehydrogenase E2 component (dihydrolipoyllysine-residue acetyltransferase)
MTSTFSMPSLGADMAAGVLVEWHRKPGDPVHRGDIIASVETDKGVIDVEVFADGTVGDLLVEPGQEVPVGTPLATIVDGSGTEVAATPRQPPARTEAPAPIPSPPPAPAAPAPSAPVSPLARRRLEEAHLGAAAVHGSGPHGRVVRRDIDAAVPPAPALAATPAPRATPRARELAVRHGIDLATVAATGPGGRILAADVTAVAGARPAAATDAGSRMRRAIAAAMSRSNRDIPHYYVGRTIDLATATEWLTTANAERPLAQRLLPAAVLVKATAMALRRHPDLNASWRDDALVRSDHVHLGVAVSLRGGGLLVPALHDADTLPLDDVMAGLRDLVVRARAAAMRSSDLADATATLSSLGDDGADAVWGVIFPPQVAVIGFGGAVVRPWVVGDAVVPRPTITATLAADHRATDGHAGSLFLTDLDRLLQEPEAL